MIALLITLLVQQADVAPPAKGAPPVCKAVAALAS